MIMIIFQGSGVTHTLQWLSRRPREWWERSEKQSPLHLLHAAVTQSLPHTDDSTGTRRGKDSDSRGCSSNVRTGF